MSTQEVGRPDRLALWGEFVRRHIGHLAADTFGDSGFAGRLELGSLGHSKLCRIIASRHRVVRTPELIRRDDRGYVKIVAQMRGVACFEQAGRKVVLSPGEWSLYDTTRAYIVSNSDAIDQIALLLPRDDLERLGIDLDATVVRRFSGRDGVGRLAYEYLTAAFRHLPDIADTDSEVVTGVANLVRLAALDKAGIDTEASLREAALSRVRALIEANLHDPNLSVEQIAAALGRSKRYLHKLFSDEGETLSAYLWRRRLERIRQDLSDPACLARSITEIAFAWGFNSSTHFSRSFRDRFGVPPRSYRSTALADAGYWQRMAVAGGA
ncbi:helix-turn-helix domain-containing protein [Desertibaculum subflavum]|uniref:helix-turn-helix domain-containing protein n=1 Tax=Desertibaculum subflavum TaxID=2268458 RepID=UPI0034D166D8